MATKKSRKESVETERDSAYFLKLLLYFVLSTIWIKYHGRLVFPLGVVLGVLFAQHDHFRIDRKVEYAILILVGLISTQAGFAIYFAVN